jgi:hypothetical protein
MLSYSYFIYEILNCVPVGKMNHRKHSSEFSLTLPSAFTIENTWCSGKNLTMNCTKGNLQQLWKW